MEKDNGNEIGNSKGYEEGSDNGCYEGLDQNASQSIKDLAHSLLEETNESVYDVGKGVNPVFMDKSGDDYNPKVDPTNDEFSSKEWIKNLSTIINSDPKFYKPYTLGCSWRDLSAVGASADVAYQTTVENLPWKALSWAYRNLRPTNDSNTFQILKPMDGIVNPE
ncbi:hypothetical protein ZYGM_002721 [Zygosaccharomyces mellis]|uniref:Pleiotropic ABC efflux transporter N-terminal domain-containing protein n=1 Tax=Zygosaccharomyces mellis TaxID=42258 RepID=A0A4C2E286_9SACH|nr:hypothetical protein ZYGM_002721 [Zygosaccharomyces mellis]